MALTKIDLERQAGNPVFTETVSSSTGLAATGSGTITAANGNISITGSGKFTYSNEPGSFSAHDLATKTYVDSVASGLGVKTACHAATTAALDATYDNGTAGVGATLTASSSVVLPNQDTTPMSVGQRLLVKDQGSTKYHQNGIYVVSDMGQDGDHPWVLTRADDFDQVSDNLEGAATFLQEGGTQAHTGWVQTEAITTFGAPDGAGNNIKFTQFSAAQAYTAGHGIDISSGTISVTESALTGASITGVDADNLGGVSADGYLQTGAISGTSGHVVKFSSDSAIGDSLMTDDGTNLGIVAKGGTSGGTVTITGGAKSNGVGGSMTVTGGQGSTDGGAITINGGLGGTGSGGDVSLAAGAGAAAGKVLISGNLRIDKDAGTTGHILTSNSTSGDAHWAALPTAPVWSTRETPNESPDGTRLYFTIDHTAIANSDSVYLNGLLQDNSYTSSQYAGNPAFVNGNATVLMSNTTGVGVGDVVASDYMDAVGVVASVTPNTSFTLADIWQGASRSGVQGVKLALTADYLLVGNTLAFAGAPLSTAKIRISYNY